MSHKIFFQFYNLDVNIDKAMYGKIRKDLQLFAEGQKAKGIYKEERVLSSAQDAEIKVFPDTRVINFCSNNYLGLCNNPQIKKAACEAIEKWGFGLSSVRFICGTQEIHKELEYKVSQFLGMDDTILYCAAFDANGGLFEPLLDEDCTIISDELNHASIIDGIRLCKAKRLRYRHSNMEDLESNLKNSQTSKYRMIVTDGVFSMDGDIAQLGDICDLAEKYDSLVVVDDSHATGYMGPNGRGTHERCGVMGRVDIITSTFGKALGGGNGGFTSGKKEIIDLLRQRSRPYLFSNSLSPATAGASIKAIEIIEKDTTLRDRTISNSIYFRNKMIEVGFDIIEGETAIIPAMIYDAPMAIKFANMLLEEGIYVIGFVYPVVPEGKARIRIQVSAAHKKEHLDKAISSFQKIGKRLNLI